MKTIVEIKQLANGAHRNQTGEFVQDPDGYIEVPESLMNKYSNAVPFMDLVIENGKLIDIIKKEPLKASEPQQVFSTPTEKLRADIDYLAALQGVAL